MALDKLPKPFDRFHRVPDARQRRDGPRCGDGRGVGGAGSFVAEARGCFEGTFGADVRETDLGAAAAMTSKAAPICEQQ